MTQATNTYRAESDPLGRFLDEKCQLVTGYNVRSTQLFTTYEQWCATEREDAGTPRAFADALKVKGFESYRSNGIRWRGIGLRAEDKGNRAGDDPGRVGRHNRPPHARGNLENLPTLPIVTAQTCTLPRATTRNVWKDRKDLQLAFMRARHAREPFRPFHLSAFRPRRLPPAGSGNTPPVSRLAVTLRLPWAHGRMGAWAAGSLALAGASVLLASRG